MGDQKSENPKAAIEAEADAKVQSAWTAFVDARVIIGECGNPKEPKPVSELWPLWESMWEAFDFTWQGLADAGWDRGDNANRAQKLKRWKAPADFQGGGEVQGEGTEAWKQATLQDYWRWSLGINGHGPGAPLASDEELIALGLLRPVAGENYFVLHCADVRFDDPDRTIEIQASFASAKGETESNKNAKVQQALHAMLGARISAAAREKKTGADQRLQLTGARAPILSEFLHQYSKRMKTPLRLSASLASFNNLSLSGVALGDDTSFFGAFLGDAADFSQTSFGDKSDFGEALLGEYANFSETTLGDEASFVGTTFSNKATFFGATIGDEVTFFEAAFGDEVTFARARLGERVNFSEATFGEGTNFTLANIGGHVLFRGANLGNQSCFSGATLGENSNFRSAILGEGADFSGATLGDRTNFSNATLGANASFAHATLGDETSFADATLKENASFSKATLGDKVNFSGATLGENAEFMYATLGNNASFQKAALADKASFTGATLGDRASFTGATLGNETNFFNVTLGYGANFSGATLGDRVNFMSATLGAYASFMSATLGDKASFTGASLGDRFNFMSATLGEGATFSGATLGDNANFFAATLGDRVNFSGATLVGFASWKNTVFDGWANFSNVNWEPATHYGCAFDGALFENTANFKSPNFTAFAGFKDATFKHRLLLEKPSDGETHKTLFAKAVVNCQNAITKDQDEFYRLGNEPISPSSKRKARAERESKDRRWSELSAGYRTAKVAMEAQGDFDREQTFYRFEVKARAKRPTINLSERFASFLYNIFSDYGASLGRPLVSIFGFLFLFASAYYTTAWCLDEAKAPFAVTFNDAFIPSFELTAHPEDAWQALEFSLNNAFRPLSALATPEPVEGAAGLSQAQPLSDKLLFNHGAGWGVFIRLLAIIQSLLSFVLAFLFALAIRRKFQIS